MAALIGIMGILLFSGNFWKQNNELEHTMTCNDKRAL